MLGNVSFEAFAIRHTTALSSDDFQKCSLLVVILGQERAMSFQRLSVVAVPENFVHRTKLCEQIGPIQASLQREHNTGMRCGLRRIANPQFFIEFFALP
jgi:hypothetical protein